MSPRASAAIIARYQEAGFALFGHIKTCEGMTATFGLAYLTEFLAEDTAEELSLRDAFEAARDGLAKALESEDILFYAHGYYKVDALGLPCFFPGHPMEVERT